jgi:hypothetical protein
MRTMSGVDLSNPDPLGLSLRQRAADRNQLARNQQQGVSFGHLGPLSDPMWDAFKESMRGTRVGNINLPASQYDVQTNPAFEGLLGATKGRVK